MESYEICNLLPKAADLPILALAVFEKMAIGLDKIAIGLDKVAIRACPDNTAIGLDKVAIRACPDNTAIGRAFLKIATPRLRPSLALIK